MAEGGERGEGGTLKEGITKLWLRIFGYKPSGLEHAYIDLFNRISHDEDMIPPKPDLLYLFGQTEKNQDAVLDTDVVNALGEDVPVALTGDDGTEASGYPGFSAWKGKLEAGGIAKERVIGIKSFYTDPADGKFKGNTFTEAQALVRYAKKRNFKNVVITASRWHMPRSFVSAVSVALREYPELRIYLLHGKELAWDESSVHSQGKTSGRRLDFMADEMKRLVDYMNKGDLASPDKVIAYLDWRDSDERSGRLGPA